MCLTLANASLHDYRADLPYEGKVHNEVDRICKLFLYFRRVFIDVKTAGLSSACFFFFLSLVNGNGRQREFPRFASKRVNASEGKGVTK